MRVVAEAGGGDDAWLRWTLDLVTGIAGLAEPARLVSRAEAETYGAVWYGVVPPAGARGPFVPRAERWCSAKMRFVDVAVGPGETRPALVYGDATSGAAPDLLYNLFAYAACLEERAHEDRHGPAHSYAFRVGGDLRRYDAPWGSWLALALVEAARRAGVIAAPPERRTRLHLTHDVDAITKAPIIRAKQGAFQTANAVRNLARGRVAAAGAEVRRAVRFAVGGGDYFRLPAVAALERDHGARSTIHVYAATPPARTLRAHANRAVFDPPYALERAPRLTGALARLADQGFCVGLHQGFDAWADAEAMAAQRAALERALGGRPVRACRQHWLRFSLADTWRAQAAAGFAVDGTLGFNDRPGFRAGVAAAFHPWDPVRRRAHAIRAVPMALMDSHLHNYGLLDAAQRAAQVATTIAAVHAVRGEASINWHQRVFDPDYGWDPEYRQALAIARRDGMLTPTALAAD